MELHGGTVKVHSKGTGHGTTLACDIPAIALSAYTRAEDRDAAYAAGFDRFVGKSALPQSLLRAVDDLLRPTQSDLGARRQG